MTVTTGEITGKDGGGSNFNFQNYAPGSAAAAASAPVTASTEDVARVGIVTETAPASDTASSGLNGRLQRIAQRITSLITALGTPMQATGGTVGLVAGTAAIGKLAANSGVDIGDVDVTSSALPTGASTSAKQDTIIGHVDGLEAAIGTTADAAATTTGSVIAQLRAIADTLRSVDDALEYETVAASQTDQMMGATGAIGDYLDGLLIIPATTSPGAVSIEDGSTNTVVFTGGATSVGDLKPFFIPLGFASVSGGWEITTGANVSVIASGNFT